MSARTECTVRFRYLIFPTTRRGGPAARNDATPVGDDLLNRDARGSPSPPSWPNNYWGTNWMNSTCRPHNDDDERVGPITRRRRSSVRGPRVSHAAISDSPSFERASPLCHYAKAAKEATDSGRRGGRYSEGLCLTLIAAATAASSPCSRNVSVRRGPPRAHLRETERGE